MLKPAEKTWLALTDRCCITRTKRNVWVFWGFKLQELKGCKITKWWRENDWRSPAAEMKQWETRTGIISSHRAGRTRGPGTDGNSGAARHRRVKWFRSCRYLPCHKTLNSSCAERQERERNTSLEVQSRRPLSLCCSWVTASCFLQVGKIQKTRPR